MAARNDQVQWWAGKTDAEIAKHYRVDRECFERGTGNYATVGGPVRFSGKEFDYVASTCGDVLDTLVAEEDAALETSEDVKRTSILAVLAVYDARDGRRRFSETAQAVTVCATDDAGKPVIADLARILGVARPTALMRYRRLVEVMTADEEFKALAAG